MARFKRFILSIVFCFGFVLPGGLPVWAAPSGAAAAGHDAKEDPLRIELERLKKERQKALDKARGKTQGKTRDGRSKRTRLSRPRARPAPDLSGRLSLSLPPGWQVWETEDAKTGAWANEIALGDTSPWSKNRIGIKLYLPGGEVSGGVREIILVERFQKRGSMTLSNVYRRWRGKVLAGCDDAASAAAPVPRQEEENGVEVIESFYACPKRKAENTASISLLKAMIGAESLIVINRVRLGSAPTPNPEAVPEALIEDWRAWAGGVTLVGVSPAIDKAGRGRDAASKGYGFIVSPQGHVLTANHLATGCRRLRFSSQATALQVNDPVKGLALFKLRRKPEAVAVFRKGSGAKVGDPVVLTSYPRDGGLAMDLSVSTGILSALVGPGGDPRQISVTAPIPPGNSGIPLVDLYGTVAGMTLDTAEALKMAGQKPGGSAASENFAIGAGTIRRFLDGLRVSYQTLATIEILSPGDAAQRAREVTVFVECWK
jgi:S1-C subfamily serine protease